MNETLELQKQKALDAYETGSKKEKNFLEKLYGKKVFLKEITERIKTVVDVLEDNDVTQEQLDRWFENVPEHFKHQFIAELLCKSLNEGWTPNWDDSSEGKYYPWFKMGSSGFRFGACVLAFVFGCRLSPLL